MQGHFEILDGFGPDVVALSAKGLIDAAAYEGELIPLVEKRIAAEGKVKLLYVLGDAFEGFTAGAAFNDAKVGMMHLADFARIAVVTDSEWVRLGMHMFAPLVRAPVKVFGTEEMEDAKAWIALNDAPKGGKAVDADHKIATLEDKGAT